MRKICVYFLTCIFACIFYTYVFHACVSQAICMKHGGFTHMKHVCNAAMPMACTVQPLMGHRTCLFLCRLTCRFFQVIVFHLGGAKFKPGLSLRAGERGFSPATKRVAPGYFYWKIEGNRTKRNPQLFDSPPTYCIYPET